MAEMQKMMEVTARENQKLRTQIKVLINDHPNLSPTRSTYSQKKFRAAKSQMTSFNKNPLALSEIKKGQSDVGMIDELVIPHELSYEMR
jgi:hypothetical protein